MNYFTIVWLMEEKSTSTETPKQKIQKKVIFKGFMLYLLGAVILFIMGIIAGFFANLWGGNIESIDILLQENAIVSFASLIISILVSALTGYYVARKAESNKIKHAYYLGFINTMLGVLIYSGIYTYFFVTHTYYEPIAVTLVNILYMATYIPASLYGAKIATQTQKSYA